MYFCLPKKLGPKEEKTRIPCWSDYHLSVFMFVAISTQCPPCLLFHIYPPSALNNELHLWFPPVPLIDSSQLDRGGIKYLVLFRQGTVGLRCTSIFRDT